MEEVSQIIRGLFPQYEPHHWPVTFDKLGVDSFDLMELRVRLEQKRGGNIPDSAWVSFLSFSDIQNYYHESASSYSSRTEVTTGITAHRTVTMNMPQMVLAGLSENWLFKELGDMHWAMVCDALESQSHDLTDELGNRLYATFVRLRLESSHHLQKFQENEQLDLKGSLFHFGKSMFFSDILLRGQEKALKAALMTTFSVRQSNNKSLLKGEPSIPAHGRVAETHVFPTFGEEYREMRRGNSSVLSLGDETFKVSQDNLFELEYKLNPYQDMNGVNLLYFAAYPAISDVCEMQFIHQTQGSVFKRHWAAESSTVARDVFYYGNCDLDDSVIFRVNSCEFVSGGKVKVGASLFRSSDHKLIANIFTVKELHG